MFTFTPGITMTAGMTFTPVLPPPTSLDYLLVAGGGGGGRYYGGGGGAGGLLTSTGYSVVSNATYTVTVGTGGPGAPSTGIGTAGTNSIVSSNNSYSFNGTSQYLSVAANTALVFGTGDFTIELWFYIPGGITGPLGLISNGNPGVVDNATWSLEGIAGGNIAFYGPNSTTQYFTTTTQPWTSGWAHIAVSRVGVNTKLFLNGVQQGSTYTINNSFAAGGNLYIGTGFYAPNSRLMPAGNISNVRLVKGVGVYTGNFTVPTGPLSATQSAGTNISAITGTQTSLLTLQNATIVDNSSYGFAITNTGSVAFSSSTPFTINSVGGGYGGGNSSASAGGPGGSGGGSGGPSSASGGAGTAGQGNNGGTNTSGGGAGGGGAGAAGGTSSTSSAGTGGVGLASTIIPNYSISFNGSSQYLTCNPGSTVAFGTGDFTVEVWAYATSALTSGDNPYICDTRGGGGVWNFGWNWNGGASPWQLAWGSTSTALQSTTSMTINTWNHCVYVRSGTVGTLYLNGVSIGTWTDSTNYSASVTSMTIARRYVTSGGVQYFPGYLSNLRIVKGTALYTSNFAVPTPPLLAITNTSLLTAQSSTIVDNSTNAFTITAIGSPTVSSTVIPTAYYSGGGGGSAGLGVLTNGGAGGGGYGATDTAGSFASAGAANTGGGGGGGSNPNSDPTWAGKNGGSGIAIIRYSNVYAQATTTGSPSLTVTGGYNIYTWTSSGSFSFSAIPTPTVEYLVVAGGGGAGLNNGGGGAGGYRTAIGFAVDTGTSYTVTVGTGGAGSSSSGVPGTNGTSSVFSTITSAGGGGGGSFSGSGANAGQNGGSGGGAGGADSGQTIQGPGLGNTPSTTPSQGNNGGSGVALNTNSGGGGGGGAGGVGGNGSGSVAGNGGIGAVSTIITTAQSTTYAVGQVSSSSVYFAGGGGAGTNGGTAGSGGLGGGANGKNSGTGNNGTANTGGGAGAGGASAGGTGGSGVVIVRYLDTYAAAASTTGTPSVNVANGYRTYIWTSSGSITF